MGCDIQLALEIEASPEAMFEAITTQKGEASFWTSDNDAEPEVGSVATFRFPGAEAPARMRIDELEPGRRVKWTSLGDFPNWEGTTITWDLTESDGKTHLMFEHAGWPESYSDHERGSITWVWAMVLGRLKGYVETGEPQPFFG